MRYNKILVFIIITGTIMHAMSNMSLKLVVAMEGQVEQQGADRVITSNIPVQGYIVPKGEDIDIEDID
jgi:hypothetical protein